MTNRRTRLLAMRALIDEELAELDDGSQTRVVASAEVVFMDSDEYARRQRISPVTVRRYARLGMPHQRIGQRLRVDVKAADEWIKGGGAARAIEESAQTSARRGE